jgi:undecaprenyl-diphosphatase
MYEVPLNIIFFQAIYGLAHRFVFLDYIGIFLADYSQYVLVVILAIWLCSSKQRFLTNRPFIIVGGLSVALARLVIKPLVLMIYAEPRPYMVLEYVRPLIESATSKDLQSFPSGHALIFFALATALYFYNKKWAKYYFAAAILMGLSRVYVGVHWPIDIVAGALIGMFSAWFIHFLYLKYTERRKVI